jgi:integral membrane sensor domain MASE1
VAALIVVLALLPSQRDVPYIVFPVLIWAALRAGPRGAAGAVALVTTLTVDNTAHHAGPFVRGTITQSLLATQLFVAAAAVTSLVLGAVIEERCAALEGLRENGRRLRTLAPASSRPATQPEAGSSATSTTAPNNAWSHPR